MAETRKMGHPGRIIAKFMSQLSRAHLRVLTVIARRIPVVLLLLSCVPSRGQNPKSVKEDRRRTEEILNQVSRMSTIISTIRISKDSTGRP
jgi:hypothetical protein